MDALFSDRGLVVGGIGHNIPSFLLEPSERENMSLVLCFANRNHIYSGDYERVLLLFLAQYWNMSLFIGPILRELSGTSSVITWPCLFLANSASDSFFILMI